MSRRFTKHLQAFSSNTFEDWRIVHDVSQKSRTSSATPKLLGPTPSSTLATPSHDLPLGTSPPPKKVNLKIKSADPLHTISDSSQSTESNALTNNPAMQPDIASSSIGFDTAHESEGSTNLMNEAPDENEHSKSGMGPTASSDASSYSIRHHMYKCFVVAAFLAYVISVYT